MWNSYTHGLQDAHLRIAHVWSSCGYFFTCSKSQFHASMHPVLPLLQPFRIIYGQPPVLQETCRQTNPTELDRKHLGFPNCGQLSNDVGINAVRRFFKKILGPQHVLLFWRTFFMIFHKGRQNSLTWVSFPPKPPTRSRVRLFRPLRWVLGASVVSQQDLWKGIDLLRKLHSIEQCEGQSGWVPQELSKFQQSKGSFGDGWLNFSAHLFRLGVFFPTPILHQSKVLRSFGFILDLLNHHQKCVIWDCKL